MVSASKAAKNEHGWDDVLGPEIQNTRGWEFVFVPESIICKKGKNGQLSEYSTAVWTEVSQRKAYGYKANLL